MDLQSGHNSYESDHDPRVSSTTFTGSEPAHETEARAMLEEVKRLRREAKEEMSKALYTLLVKYRAWDQSLVDNYTEWFEQSCRRFPGLADTLSSQACVGLPEIQNFQEGELFIRVHAYPDVDLHPPPADRIERGAVAAAALPRPASRNSVEHSHPQFTSPLSSPLSSVPNSPLSTSEHEQAVILVNDAATRRQKHPKRPLSPDELSFDAPPLPTKFDGRDEEEELRTPQQKPRRPPLRTYSRKLSAAISTQTQRTDTQPKQDTQPRSTTKQRCCECRRRRIKCSGTKPRCRHCKRQGKPCGYDV